MASRGAGAQNVTVNATGSGFDPEEMKYLFKFIFPFLCSGSEIKRGAEFRRSTFRFSPLQMSATRL